MHLNFENRIRLNKEAGGLVHSFGEGYYIVDENGEWVNTFSDEERFNQLIDKFRYRYFLLEKLNNAHSVNFDFGEELNKILTNKPFFKKLQNIQVKEKKEKKRKPKINYF